MTTVSGVIELVPVALAFGAIVGLLVGVFSRYGRG